MSTLNSSRSLGQWSIGFWMAWLLCAMIGEMPPRNAALSAFGIVWFLLAVFTTLRWLWRRHTIRKARIQAEAMVEAMDARRAVAR